MTRTNPAISRRKMMRGTFLYEPFEAASSWPVARRGLQAGGKDDIFLRPTMPPRTVNQFFQGSLWDSLKKLWFTQTMEHSCGLTQSEAKSYVLCWEDDWDGHSEKQQARCRIEGGAVSSGLHRWRVGGVTSLLPAPLDCGCFLLQLFYNFIILKKSLVPEVRGARLVGQLSETIIWI